MSHRRDEIRKYIIDVLIDKTDAKERVYDSRFTPFQHDKYFPCISIITQKEIGQNESYNPCLIKRRAHLTIAVMTKQSEGGFENTDKILFQIENIINNINHTNFTFEYESTESDVSVSVTPASVITTLNYICTYYTDETKNACGENLEILSLEVPHG